MIKGLISRLFKNRKGSSNFAIIELNDKIQPIDRGLTYEDPLDLFLKENLFGEVSGGGTFQEKTGEIAGCDIEIELFDLGMIDENVIRIINKMEDLGAPKGSKLTIERTGREIKIGKLEGMAIYLDGVNLPDEVYEKCDINYLIEQFNEKLEYSGIAERNWQGAEVTALYYYGKDFQTMHRLIKDLLSDYPLCQGCKVVQIA